MAHMGHFGTGQGQRHFYRTDRQEGQLIVCWFGLPPPMPFYFYLGSLHIPASIFQLVPATGA